MNIPAIQIIVKLFGNSAPNFTLSSNVPSSSKIDGEAYVFLRIALFGVTPEAIYTPSIIPIDNEWERK